MCFILTDLAFQPLVLLPLNDLLLLFGDHPRLLLHRDVLIPPLPPLLFKYLPKEQSLPVNKTPKGVT